MTNDHGNKTGELTTLPFNNSKFSPVDIRNLLSIMLASSEIIEDCNICNNHIIANYSYISYKGKTYSVHRLTAHLFHNLDLDNSNLLACHKNECKSKRCWNPDHIYVGNAHSNAVDYVNSPNFKNYNKEKKHCNNGHLLKGNNLRIEFGNSRRCKACHNIASAKYRKKIS